MKSPQFANDVLRLVFHGTPIPGLAQNAAFPLAELYVSLHRAQPKTAQTDSEAKFTRQRLVRSSAGWTITGNICRNAAVIEFGEGDGGTITHIGIGSQAQGAGRLLYSGALNPSRGVPVGHLPRFAAGEIEITET